MPQDYSGQNLRGQNFRGMNLEEANFSGADIRSADFSGAILKGANFSGAIAGLQRRWAIFLVVVSWLLMGLSGFLSAFAGYLVASLLFKLENDFEIAYQIAGCTIVVISIIFFLVTIHQGIQAGLKAFAVAFAGAFAVAFAVAVAFAGIFAVAGAIAFAFAFAFAFAGAFAFAILASHFTVHGGAASLVAFVVAFAVAFAVVLLSTFITWRAFKGDPKHALIRDIAVAFAASRGTSFHSANLSHANFTAATLKSTDFRKAILTCTIFHKTKKLDRVRPGTTYLQKVQVRQVLVTSQGLNQNFDRQDLRGVNFTGANLVDASFINADLSNANLQDADLSRAKLVQAQLDGTDFTGAALTGAYIEDWNITSDTKFDGVRCEYVYMRLPTKENPDPLRKPDNNFEVFADGEFGDFIQPIFDTLDLYHNQGVDPRAIAISFKQLAEKHPDAELRIVGMEVKGEDKFLLRTKTAPNTDKSQLSQEYFEKYNPLKGSSDQEIKLLLQDQDSKIHNLETSIQSVLQGSN
ncbi:MAG: pentapeptide repeat-containing protein, partial [Rhizonema sp. NSF051]|nr:pentapeptide repeat-containing protein [Rhizonema sp. NSF051]